MRTATLTVALLLSLILVGPAFASQATGHMYVARQVADRVDEPLRTIIDDNFSWYEAGSTGPDIALLTWLLAEALGLHHPGVEAHYEKTGQLIVNMFKKAHEYTDETERNQRIAFTAGWLTHFCTDSYIHPLVNQFGGYFGAGGDYITRHKRLELFECTHVLQKVIYPGAYWINHFSVPEKLINDAFAATFPYNLVYRRPIGVNEFILDLHKSALLMGQCTKWMLECYETDTAVTSVFSIPLKGHPPTKEQYKKMMDPLLIDEVELEPGDPVTGKQPRVKVTYTVHDLKIHKLWANKWDQVIPQAVSESVSFLNAYNRDPAGFTLPDRNLDTGGAEGSTFDISTAYPGEPPIERLLVFLDEFTDRDGKDMRPDNWAPDGQWVPLPLTAAVQGGPDMPVGIIKEETIWTDYKSGTCFFRFPYDDTRPGPYQLKFRVAFAHHPSKQLIGWPPDPKLTIQKEWSGELGAKPDLSILFLVDTSGSMGGRKIAAAISAVKSSVDQTNDGKTEWCLVRFGGCKVTVVSRFTTDPNKIKAAADTLGAGGDTPLMYARGKALEYLVTRGQGKQGRLIVLCDGQDNCREHGSIGEPEAAANLRQMIQTIEEARMRNR